jgi:hypothetical protein
MDHPRPPAAPEFPDVPGYQILGRLGEGGTGVVYRARHLRLNRLVALKMLRTGHGSATEEQRFRAEAEALARLQHPNIVQIFDVGDFQGRPYCALEFVGGGSLDLRLRDAALAPAAAARLVADLARVVQAVHGLGLIHRDLKPANILLTANGVPKIADFGLAKFLDDPSRAATHLGNVLGTPNYMAPEQAAGLGVRATTAMDIYGLGAILYECLTGRPPFQAATLAETLGQVRTQEPEPIRHVQPGVPRDLEAICLKCMRKEPRHRYSSAQALADDLQHFLDGKPTHARPATTTIQAWRWARRHLVLAGLGALLIATVLALAHVFAERDDLRVQLEVEREQHEQAEMMAYPYRIAAACRAMEAKDFVLAAEWLKGCPPDSRLWEHRYLSRQVGADWPSGDRTLKGHQGQVDAVAFSPNGLRLASAGTDSSLLIWDLATGRELRKLNRHEAGVHDVCFSPDGRRLASASYDRTVRIWDIETGEERAVFRGHTAEVYRACFSPDGRRLVSTSEDGTARIWDPENVTGECVTIRQDKKWFVGVNFSPDGRLIATNGPGDSVCLWDSTSGALVRTIPGAGTAVNHLRFSPDGAQLVAAAGEPDIQVFDVANGRRLLSLEGHASEVYAIRFTSDGRRLVSASEDGTMRLWDARTGVALVKFRAHGRRVHGVAVSPDGHWLATCGEDGVVRLWDGRPIP